MLTLVKMAEKKPLWHLVNSNWLADVIRNRHSHHEQVMIVDSRSFLEYNTCHIVDSVNVCCSKLVKRRLQQGKVSVKDLLAQACSVPPEDDVHIVVYDQCTEDPAVLSTDCFLSVLLKKLITVFKNVSLLKGGFLDFQATHGSLCESKQTSSGSGKCPPLTSMSQPCMPVTNVGPTKILPFLYLGSQKDALSQEVMQINGITYMLNVSTVCPQPPFIQDGHFLRIPVNDNYSDKLLPFFQDAFQFLDKVREANGCVLIHCLAGISRSPTLAIAYIMKYLNMTSDEAYRYVKDKRPTISPNFNFLGQLLEYEKQLRSEPVTSPASSAALKRQCLAELRSPTSPTVATPKVGFGQIVRESKLNAQSPTTALAKLSFAQANSPANTPTKDSNDPVFPAFPAVPTASLDCLSFVPCLVKDDVSRGCASDSKLSGGTKRPHSFNMGDQSWSPGARALPDSQDTSREMVTLRSPEMKAKRPLVRPNSIAFSSYPKFDPVKEVVTPPNTEGKCCKTLTDTATDCAHWQEESAAGKHTVDSNDNNAVYSCPFPANSKEIKDNKLSGNLEQARKSRSYEDILQSPYEDEKCAKCGKAAAQSCCHVTNVMDTFAAPSALEHVQCRCRGASDPHQSNSSISSSGSHNSLHGSLELIPVS